MDPSLVYYPSRDACSPDVENSFFRSWALRARGSEISSASDVSPGSRTPNSLVSPKSRVRSRGREHPSYESRFSDSHVHRVDESPSLRGVVATTDTLSPAHSERKASDRTTTATRVSVDSLASKARSNSSSITKRTMKLMKGPVLPKPSITISDTKPTRSAKGGFAWKRQVSGHWLEIRVGRRAETDVKSLDKESFETPEVPVATPFLGSQTNGQAAHASNAMKAKSPLSPTATKSTDSSSLEAKSKKSIITRTKRILGIRSTVTLPTSNSKQKSSSGTGETLDRASSALRELAEKHKMTPPSGSTSTSNLSTASIAGRPKPRHHLLRPSYRRQHTGHSSSSSVLRVMLGNPPVSTPNDDCMYMGSDAQQYFRVELTEPNAPTYLPSEARRIGTPPLPGNGAKLRGFFFDYNAPRSAREQGQGVGAWPSGPINTAPLPHRKRDKTMKSSRPTTPRSPSARLQSSDDDVAWFRVKVAMEGREDERDKFELNVPEHLPSSPLCPRHPKHKSGGKGVCVYHGRNRIGVDDPGDMGAGWR
ncbi:MAG: hypothetical protein LQ343_003088 [Gyalolechia ehrenbergii]|nr:MAG: hypothetical protein LQ343_003088 [Gyalolechia ehrenbergii]